MNFFFTFMKILCEQRDHFSSVDIQISCQFIAFFLPVLPTDVFVLALCKDFTIFRALFTLSIKNHLACDRNLE